MKSFFRELSLVFSAGALGGLMNSLALWFVVATGLAAALGVGLGAELTAPWLYPRLVWGGIWGALFVLPFMKEPAWARGLLYSLGPTLVQLFVVFPLKLQKGVLGLGAGALTPLFVIFLNAVWGVCAAYWLRYARE